MHEEKAFNLLHEKWLRAMKSDGKTEGASLLGAFRKADVYLGLAGELPTQDVAVLRLLLAIMHAVFSRYDLDGNNSLLSTPEQALTRWKLLWEKGSFPMHIIEEYLLHFEERFWLFHPQYPFYQVSLAEPVTDAEGDLIVPTLREASLLIGDVAESDNKVRLFSARQQKNQVTLDEAARWLVYTNMFDVSPGGRPASTGTTVKGYGLSWLSQLGLVWAVGSNLFETLMLNFVLANENTVWNESHVTWEKEPPGDGESLKVTKPTFPDNPGELLTMQFRRMQLLRSEDSKYVIGYRLWSGQQLDISEAQELETMTLWRKDREEKTVPKLHNSTRQVWRDFSAILSTTIGPSRPGVINWISKLKRECGLDLPLLQLNTAGVEYRQRTAIADVFTDSLRFSSSLLLTLGEDWIVKITNMIEETEGLVRQVGYLAQNLAKAAGLTEASSLVRSAEEAVEQAYHRLDSPFRRWLEGLAPEQEDMNDECNKWLGQASAIIRGLGKELVDRAGPQAMTGRYVNEKIKGKEVEKLYTAPQAYSWFLSRTRALKA